MKTKTTLFVQLLFAFIAYLGIIRYIFNLTGLKFYGELFLVIGLLFMSIVGIILAVGRINFGNMLTGLIGVVLLMNLSLFYLSYGESTLLLSGIISSIGLFVVSIFAMEHKKKKPIDPPLPPPKPEPIKEKPSQNKAPKKRGRKKKKP